MSRSFAAATMPCAIGCSDWLSTDAAKRNSPADLHAGLFATVNLEATNFLLGMNAAEMIGDAGFDVVETAHTDQAIAILEAS
jgi:hypothetical protein